MTVDQRDGVVLFAMNAGAGDDSPGLLAGIDAETGRQLWRKEVPDYFFGRPAKKNDECFVNPAIAADRAVVIAFLGCDSFPSDKLPGLYGIDLKTGKELWSSAFWEKPESMFTTDGKKVRPHTDDGRVFPQSDVSSPVFVDSETGEVKAIEEPAPRKLDGRPFWWPICDDFRAIDYSGAGERSDDCFFANGEVDVFVRELTPAKNVKQLHVEAVETKTGKSLWTWDRRLTNKPKKYEFHYLEFLGWNSDRSEFWLLQDQKDVIRLDAKTGEPVGQGLAAPPMELINIAIAGPKFVLTRTAGGITNPDGTGVKSGANYYVTDAD
jgi:outer membrane protein assembly factor BamB